MRWGGEKEREKKTKQKVPKKWRKKWISREQNDRTREADRTDLISAIGAASERVDEVMLIRERRTGVFNALNDCSQTHSGRKLEIFTDQSQHCIWARACVCVGIKSTPLAAAKLCTAPSSQTQDAPLCLLLPIEGKQKRSRCTMEAGSHRRPGANWTLLIKQAFSLRAAVMCLFTEKR